MLKHFNSEFPLDFSSFHLENSHKHLKASNNSELPDVSTPPGCGPSGLNQMQTEVVLGGGGNLVGGIRVKSQFRFTLRRLFQMMGWL